MDDSFYELLARMIDEEPAQTRDLVAIDQARSQGIEKGKPFKPDEAMRSLLKKAAAEAQQELIRGAMNNKPFWPGKHWGLPDTIGPETGWTFIKGDRYALDQRALMFYLFCAPPKKLGAATIYVSSSVDVQGRDLDGSRTYRLHVPPNVPAKQYWAATVYDPATAAFIREAPNLAIDSYKDSRKNADGSVDIYFAPKPPAGQEKNWIYTAPGKRWFTLFRFYGPERPLFDKTWVLPDIEKVD